jgi:hypothetical protein
MYDQSNDVSLVYNPGFHSIGYIKRTGIKEYISIKKQKEQININEV